MKKREKTGKAVVAIKANKAVALSGRLLSEIRGLIIETRAGVARQVNSALGALYWHIGRRIHQDILKEKRAEYGAEILQALSAKLIAEFGQGFPGAISRPWFALQRCFLMKELSRRC